MQQLQRPFPEPLLEILLLNGDQGALLHGAWMHEPDLHSQSARETWIAQYFTEHICQGVPSFRQTL